MLMEWLVGLGRNAGRRAHGTAGRAPVRRAILLAAAAGLLCAPAAFADYRTQARRIHDRLAGVPPTNDVLNTMTTMVQAGNAVGAAEEAMKHRAFYDVTLKNFATPWTNRDQTVFAPLNDYVATVIGIVRDDVPFNQVLYEDILYVGNAPGLPAYSPTNNDHYAALERGFNLKDVLGRTTQSAMSGLPANATAGVMTTRAAARAFFIAGTNRAMFRFTLMNHLCRDMEQVMDTTRPPDRIRQDVSRSPGGDSRVFLNNCIGCHSGMDPMAQAFAYYDWEGEEDEAAGRIVYTPGVVALEVLQQRRDLPPRLRDAGRPVGQLLAARPEQPAGLGFDAARQRAGREVTRPRAGRQRRLRTLPGREGVPQRLLPATQRRSGSHAGERDDGFVQGE